MQLFGYTQPEQPDNGKVVKFVMIEQKDHKTTILRMRNEKGEFVEITLPLRAKVDLWKAVWESMQYGDV